MKRSIAIGLLVTTISCSSFQQAQKIVADMSEIAGELRKVTDSLAAADTNKDNAISSDELVAWVGAGGGALLIGLWTAFRKLRSAKGQLWPEIAALKEKVLTIEAGQDKST